MGYYKKAYLVVGRAYDITAEDIRLQNVFCQDSELRDGDRPLVLQESSALFATRRPPLIAPSLEPDVGQLTLSNVFIRQCFVSSIANGMTRRPIKVTDLLAEHSSLRFGIISSAGAISITDSVFRSNTLESLWSVRVLPSLITNFGPSQRVYLGNTTITDNTASYIINLDNVQDFTLFGSRI
jgi:hypothetical protein